MLLTADAATVTLAPVVGGYLCVSAAGLARGGSAGTFLDDLVERPAAMHATGAIAFLAGAAVLSLHRHWAWPAGVVLNLVAAGWLIEGAGMLADAGRVRRALASPRAAGRVRTMQRAGGVVGLYLVAVGLFGAAP